jgi:WD40 repeat protein
VQSWTLPGLQPLAAWDIPKQNSPYTVAVFNAGATRVAVGDRAGHVRMHETTSQLLRSFVGSQVEIEALAWSPDSETLAVGTKGGTVRLWTAREGLPSIMFFLNFGSLGGIQFSPDGCWLLVGMSSAASMKVWNIATGEQLLTAVGAPAGFSSDGRCLATSRPDQVSFFDLVVPRSIHQFYGHGPMIELLSWSRNSRTLASIDTRFYIGAWSIGVNPPRKTFFGPPPGTFYASNAALSLSDDGEQLAYASGGEKAVAIIRDLSSGKDMEEWDLEAGFEKLGCSGGAKFLLVREELSQDRENVRTVVWELEAGQKPIGPRLIRPTQPGDERRFEESGLSRDGRYHWWDGPRRPKKAERYEVREVATGKLLFPRRDERPWGPVRSSDVYFDPNRGELWVKGNDIVLRYDLGDITRPPIRERQMPLNLSPDLRWNIAGDVCRWPENRLWLLLEDDYANSRASFSPDSHYLALGRRSGYLTVMDLPALEQEIAAFEGSLRK